MVREPHTERIAATHSAPRVGERPSGDAEQPGPGVAGFLGQVLEAAPGHQEGVSDDVLRTLVPVSAADEAEDVAVRAVEQGGESLLAIMTLRCAHVPLLSGTGAGVSEPDPKAARRPQLL